MNMNKKYERPEADVLWFRLDILTLSGDNDAPFGGENSDDQNWSQYY